MIIRIRDGFMWALAGLGVVLAAALSSTPTKAGQPGEMCERYQSTPVDGGYVVSTNRWNSLGDLCLATSGGTDFRVTRSTIDPANVEVPGRGPGAYRTSPRRSATTGSRSPSMPWPVLRRAGP